ncbi:unnamed protein product [Angiostrongylus costaricensis]|uniref:DCB domain-containing protein n=1 Tax=Angiostrongylus costaricensis TaxID=334426 RepID=A0A0R3PT76_ANGCS|nr:unnamed protein product [Angiostrongylus costaricensis]
MPAANGNCSTSAALCMQFLTRVANLAVENALMDMSTLMNVIFDLFDSKAPASQGKTDSSVDKGLRGAEALLVDNFYGVP